MIKSTPLVGRREGGSAKGALSFPPLLESAETGLVSQCRCNPLFRELNSPLSYDSTLVFKPLSTYEWRCQKQEAEEVQSLGVVYVSFAWASAASFSVWFLLLPSIRKSQQPVLSLKQRMLRLRYQWHIIHTVLISWKWVIFLFLSKRQREGSEGAWALWGEISLIPHTPLGASWRETTRLVLKSLLFIPTKLKSTSSPVPELKLGGNSGCLSHPLSSLEQCNNLLWKMMDCWCPTGEVTVNNY